MKTRTLGCLLFSVVLPFASAHAANLLQNPDFDQGLAGWMTHSTVFAVDSADGSPSAPAAQFSTTAGSLYVTQCVSLAGSPPPWAFGARVRVVQSTGSSCKVSIYSAFDTGTCAARLNNYGAPASAGAPVAGVQGDFTAYAGTASDPMPGVDHSNSAELVVQVTCTNSADAMTINVDHALLGTAGTMPVRLQSFEVK